MTNRLLIACSALVALASATAVAQQAFVPPPGGLRFVERYMPQGSNGDTKIVGTVIDIRQIPVVNARVQLRDLSTGLVEQEDTSNENGDYEFPVVNPGTYIVEVVLVDGYVMALSNAGSLARFETLQTVIQLPGRWDALNRRMIMRQDATSFLGLSAQTSITARTLEMAIELSLRPLDAGEPVSPNRP